MAKGKRFYKKYNNNGENHEAAQIQKETANADTGSMENRNNRNDVQGGKPGDKPNRRQGGYRGNRPNYRPGGKPPRKFDKNSGNKNTERNDTNRADMNRKKVPAPGGAKVPGKGTGRLLIAYFSWSGVTEKAAQTIASAAKGNTYRIIPVNAYPSIYALCVAKAGMEKASGARPELKGTLPDCSRYEKIAIGFPIWWFDCPLIVRSFLEKVQLDGKKVYPFCTSKTSGPKSSADTIRKIIPGADVKDCLDANNLERMTAEEIKNWLEM